MRDTERCVGGGDTERGAVATSLVCSGRLTPSSPLLPWTSCFYMPLTAPSEQCQRRVQHVGQRHEYVLLQLAVREPDHHAQKKESEKGMDSTLFGSDHLHVAASTMKDLKQVVNLIN